MNSVEERSAKTAEMLRTMREQTDKALDSYRHRIEDLESELSRRIQQIAEELMHDQEVEAIEEAAAAKQTEELRATKEALRRAENEISAMRGQLSAQASDQEAEFAARAEQLQQLLTDRDQEVEEYARLAETAQHLEAERDQLLQERANLSEELGQVLTEQLKSSEELVQMVEQLEQLQQDLDQATHERTQLAEDLEQFKEDADQTTRERNELTTQVEQLCEERERERHDRELLTEELQRIQAERDELAAERGGLADQVQQLQACAEEQDRQREQLAAELEHRVSEASELVQARDEMADELEELRNSQMELVAQRDQVQGDLKSLRDELASVKSDKDALAEQCAGLTGDLATAAQLHGETQQQIQSLEAQLQAQREEHARANEALAESRSQGQEFSSEAAKYEQLVDELREELEQLKATYDSQLEEANDNLEQTNRKCELALADVHKLKKANAELHEELVSRPAMDDQDSPELVSLRAERDALAARVEELENSTSAPQEGDGQEAMTDMQRRFEMAVEDVRNLKQENAALREKLEAAPKAAGAPVDGGGMDWQSQKARLLAALDAEGGADVTAERREERTTIEGTISITDRVVSEKDREIAELRAQLSQRPAAVEKPSEIDREEALRAAHEELFSNDELIQSERARLEQLQNEWKEKVRTAELDISVQRATLARERAKLDEKLAYLQSQSTELETAEGKPKRRWLSALGLNDEKSD